MSVIEKVIQEQGDANNTNERQKHYKHIEDKEILYWIEEDAKYFLHQELSTPVLNILSETKGASITDLSGNSYIDLHGNGVHNTGFSNPSVIHAVKNQLDSNLAFTPRRYSNIPIIQLARKLASISPEGLSRSLFAPGGSEAVEMAIMLAKQATGRWKTISFRDAYHGTGFQAASVSGEEHFSTGNGPMVPGAFHVDFPNFYRNPWGYNSSELVEQESIRQIKEVIKRHPDIACIIGEPVSATPWVPSKAYWEEVRSICDAKGIFLVFDEIIEGFGRTGKFFASEHYVTPDVLVMGKSLGGGLLPFAGIIAKEEHNVLQHRSIGHYTHEKNPLCAAAALANINYIEENHIVKQAKEKGDYLKDKLLALKDKHPAVGNVEGLGLHQGIDLVKDRATKEKATQLAEQFMYACLNKGVAFKIIEGNVITLRPSLIITYDEIDYVISVFNSELTKLTGSN